MTRWLAALCLLASPAGLVLASGLPSEPRRADQQRPDQQYQTDWFGKPLIIGGEYELSSDWRTGHRLGRGADTAWESGQRFELEFDWRWSAQLRVFLEAKGSHDISLSRNDDNYQTGGELQRGETWLDWHQPGGPWGFRVGRQNFDEPREWWWDEDLDALRLFYRQGAVRAELALAEELARTSSERPLSASRRDVRRLLGRLQWEWSRKQQLALYVLRQRDRSDTPAVNTLVAERDVDSADADLNWWGVRASGRVKNTPLGRLHYNLDWARVSGREHDIDFDPFSAGVQIVDGIVTRDLDGWAFDLTLTAETELPLKPHFTLGYAIGSGDSDPNDATDHAFRQTGLDDNNGDFGGVDGFRYYGELLRPELSNLRVFTAAVGLPLMQNSSLELVYHRYRQVNAASRIRGDRLRISPDGNSTELGQEWDLVLGIEEHRHWEIEAVLAAFKAGDAFGASRGNWAKALFVSATYNF